MSKLLELNRKLLDLRTRHAAASAERDAILVHTYDLEQLLQAWKRRAEALATEAREAVAEANAIVTLISLLPDEEA